jgi:putative ABC transport system permease protein
VVRAAGRVSALDRKLIRDVWRMKGQALAISLVIAAGVTIFTMYQSTFDSLRRTERAYYARQRFADVFASLKRAPQSLETRIAELPSVAVVDTRVVMDVTLDLPDLSEPGRGRLVSIPSQGRPRLNDLYLRSGRWIEPGRPDEVLASEAFVRAHHFSLGATIGAVINGRLRNLRIVGVALSPEYVYVVPPGEIIPDDERYGVFWMDRRALAAAFQMEGGFNDVTVSLERGASTDESKESLDRLLEPYGGLGALQRALQPSNWTLDAELKQLQNFGVVVPLIFLGVAGFLVNVVLARTLAIQRPQIAVLKALGYKNREIVWHYVKWALVIGGAGVAVGTLCGAWLGSGMIGLYNQYFRFPLLDYHLSPGVAFGAAAFGLGCAALGAILAARWAVAVPPAEAMRPETPARYRESVLEKVWPARRITHVTRMVLRNLERHPVRTAASVLGVATATAIVVVGFFFIDSMKEIMRQQFSAVMRQDVTVTFVEPVSASSMDALRALPGVMRAERFRVVPARLRFEHYSREVSVTGLEADGALNRIIDRSGRVVPLPSQGLVLSRVLANALHVLPGDHVEVEVLEGARPTLEVPVSDLADDLVGLSAWMELEALHRLLREGGTLSGAYLQVDRNSRERLYRTLKGIPAIAGVNVTEAARESFAKVTAQNMTLTTTFNLIFACIIAFGVVYNAARISLSERSRELASLRVLGFTIAEISLILLGELAAITLVAIPPGIVMGYGLSELIVKSVESELYRIPFVATPRGVALSALVVIFASALSALVVRRRLDRLDLVAVLKEKE